MTPVQIDQVLEGVTDRCRVVSYDGAGLWTVANCRDGASGPIHESTILTHLTLTKIQPGQIWLNLFGTARTIKSLRWSPTANGGLWIWDHDIGFRSEDFILANWTFVDPSAIPSNPCATIWPPGHYHPFGPILPDAPTPKPVIKKLAARCPLCGGVGHQGFNMFACENFQCRNYQKPKF